MATRNSQPAFPQSQGKTFWEYTLFENQTTSGASNSMNIEGFDQHSVQLIFNSGAPSVEVRTSLDGTNWFVETTKTSDDLVALEGKAKFLDVKLTQNSGDITAYGMSGN